MTEFFRIRPRPFRLAHVLLLALFVLSLSAISCRQVTDPAGTVTLQKADVDKCIQQCNNEATARILDQTKIHRVLVFLCHGSNSCIQQENQRFQAAMAVIQADRMACIQNCQHQGGAAGGR